jgi:hypothetical protein
MRSLGIVGAALAGLGLGGSIVAQPAQAADTYVVHGINGIDLGQNEALPVDIAVDGACAFERVEFGEVLGPANLDTGPHQIRVSLADEQPCAGPLALTARIDVSIAETAIVVAHLDQQGAPRLSKFTTNADPLDHADARLTAYHTAAAPNVDLRVRQPGVSGFLAAIKGLANGEASFPAEVPAGSYELRVSPSTESGAGFNPPLADIPIELEAGSAYAVFAAGSLANETFTAIPIVIRP